MQKIYTIEARSYDLLSIASHNFWVLRDEQGNAIADINSNSAYHLFARLMEIECCRFAGVLEPEIHNPLISSIRL